MLIKADLTALMFSMNTITYVLIATEYKKHCLGAPYSK